MEHNLYSQSGKKSYYNHTYNQNRDRNQYSVPTSYNVGAHWTSDDLGNQPQFSPQFMVRSGSLYSQDSSLEAQISGQSMYRHDSQSSNSTGYNNPAYSPVDYNNTNFSVDQNSNYFPAAANQYPVQQPPSLGMPTGWNPTWETPRTELASYEHLVGGSPNSPMSPMQSTGYVLQPQDSHNFSLNHTPNRMQC